MKRPVPHRLDVGNRAGAADTAFLSMLTQMLTLKTVKLGYRVPKLNPNLKSNLNPRKSK